MSKPFQKQHLYVFSLLILATILRLFALNTLPLGINQDEAMGAVDALALSKYGTDRFGTYLPTHFEAWGYSQMSVLLSYFMIPFIRFLGFNIIAIRLPLALFSILSIYIIYLISKKLFTEKIALLIMFLTTINPWQIMQSRWALDCNIFPHLFLLAFYLLLCGLEKKRYLYFSMILFALTFYTYGVAIYTVPVFLFVFALHLLITKQVTLKTLLICALLFLFVSLPEIITMALNLLKFPTLETPFFTMPFFPDTIRGNDILFMNFSFSQLFENIWFMISSAFLQFPDHIFNSLPAFGPLYHISTPFIFIGTFAMIKRLVAHKGTKQFSLDLALLGFLLTGILAGMLTYRVNINRINIIFYPLIILCGYGFYYIYTFIKSTSLKKIYLTTIPITYILYFTGFIYSYHTDFKEEITTYFNVDFLEIMEDADSIDDIDTLIITPNMGWQTNTKMAEILTQYACNIDAKYFQGKTNVHKSKPLLAYTQRYYFVGHDFNYPLIKDNSLYILHTSELDDFPYDYQILIENNNFKGIAIK